YEQFQPENYQLEIKIDESAMRFSGTVTIRGKKVGRPSQRLTFHANGLKVTTGKVTFHDKKGDKALSLARINLQKSLHEVRLHTEDMVYPGNYTVEMSFEAPITDGMTGIYPCYFKDGKAEKKLFATQFESHHAREAFPCIDEPEAKATFDLSLVTQPGIETLGNMPIAEQSKTKNGLRTTFETSPKMSSYLLAFVVGDIHKKSTKTKSGVEVNTWATIAQPAESLDFALDVAKRCIEYFEDYFGVPYPLPKADHIALPDFSSGAMENWGLITYRERVLLDYPGETSQSTREYIALVVAHETSHQWFGNLVTMRWWDDLWLNESFANMMEYQAVDSMFPEWQVWNTAIASEGLSAFRRDAIAGVQPVHVDVHHPDEISTLFDPSIVYAKGGRLLYMLKNYIGDDAFRDGLAAYFTKHAYGNTAGDDLWAALGAASGKDIGAFMTPWLSRPGFPVVRVEQDKTSVQLVQEQFMDDRTKADPERLWPVPLFANNPAPELLANREVAFDVVGDIPLLVNTGGRGHYIVDYRSAVTKDYIEAALRKLSLPEPDRLMLLNASAMLARAGYQSYADTLDLLSAYEVESSEPVWDIIGLVASEVRRFVELDDSLEKPIKTMTRNLISAQYGRLGWEANTSEPAADTKLRSLVIGLGIYSEHKEILGTARGMFEELVVDKQPLPADLRHLVMSVPVKEGDAAAVQYLLDLHDSTHNSDLKGDIADALTATRDPKLAKKLLGRLKDSKLVKPQDVDKWLVYLLRNRYTKATAWEWMVDEWSWLQKTFENDKSYDYLPRYAASVVNTAAYEQQYHDLFESKLNQPMLKRNIQIGFEEISSRRAWLDRDLKAVQAFFK
ncbi:M1 family metallopeptidase, partial [Candidatus Saccharibacteria bacterium]|nr:M1 family metallopeptidase [Candidatus Saccharibacteria bacterium]